MLDERPKEKFIFRNESPYLAKICNSSLISQKGESQNGCYKQIKHAKFSEKLTFLPPDTHTYVCVSRGKKYQFFGKFGVLHFLVTTVSRFALLPYCRRICSHFYMFCPKFSRKFRENCQKVIVQNVRIVPKTSSSDAVAFPRFILKF